MELRTDHVAVRPMRPEDSSLYEVLWAAALLPGDLTLTVCAPEPVGFVALHGSGPEVALSCVIASHHQGRGVALEAVTGVLHRVHELGVRQVEARVHVDDRRSPRLLRACGFVELADLAPERRLFRWSRDGSGRPPAWCRRCRPADLDWAWEVYCRTMRESTVALLGAWRDQGRASVVEAFDTGRARVIERDGPIGWFAVDDEERLVLGHLYVAPERQGSGVGSRVIANVLARGADERREVGLSVIHTNPRARALYERMGFTTETTDAHKHHMVWTAVAPARGEG